MRFGILLRKWRTLFPDLRANSDIAKLREVGRLFQLEGEVEIAQKESGRLENIKNVDDLDKKDELIQLQKGNVKAGGHLQFRIKKLKTEIENGGI